MRSNEDERDSEEDDSHESLKRAFMEKFAAHIAKLKKEAVTLVITPTMSEESLVDVLSQIPVEEAGLEYFIDLGGKLLKAEAYELLKIVKTHIEYNFDVELVTKNGITKYEICKKS